MRRAVLFLGLALGFSWSQPVWIERQNEQVSPPLRAQAYRIGLDEWVLFLKVELEAWLPYAFDTVIPTKLQVYTEEGLAAETLITLPTVPQWKGSVKGRFPPSLGGEMTALYLSFPDAPQGTFHTRVYWRSGCTPIWVESETSILKPPIYLRNIKGEVWQASPGDSLWHVAFEAAKVDTTVPLPPYVLRTSKRPYPPAHMDCAWYLRGDTSSPFWTCEGEPFRYKLPKPSRTTPSLSDWRAAYRLFSDKKVGERTDRGLVYLFYGPPPLRLHTPAREVWVYPQEQVSYHFVWEKGSWRLIRRLEYQSVWKRR
ncbi:MAG: hypothetical protein N3E49_01080 [Bacteroidia bacterium]|nr:hypothetical protein [Bacteroidia bacterium]